MIWNVLTRQAMQHATQTFGERVQYYPLHSAPYTVSGIVDQAYHVVDPDTGTIVQSTQPKVGFNRSDLQHEPVIGDELLMREQRYRVVEVQPDGQAAVEVFLHRLEDTPCTHGK